MSSNNVVGDLWIGGPMRRGPMRWGTNEMGDQWVGGTNEMGDQWNGWCMGANCGTNEMGDLWDGGPMRWGTNEMGNQWDGGPMMCTRLKYGHGTEQATSHYLKQWWSSLTTHICVTTSLASKWCSFVSFIHNTLKPGLKRTPWSKPFEQQFSSTWTHWLLGNLNEIFKEQSSC